MIPSHDELGSWINLYTVENGGQYRLDPKHWDEITAAYAHWYERKIDRVLNVTALAGFDVVLAASRIADAALSTPGARERDRELESAMKAEQGYEAE